MAWQRQQKAACLYEDGLTYRQIGDLFGVSNSRAAKLAKAGRKLALPDETVFADALTGETPVQCLPISKATRAALTEFGIQSFGDLQVSDHDNLHRALLRKPNFRRKHIDELDRLNGMDLLIKPRHKSVDMASSPHNFEPKERGSN